MFTNVLNKTVTVIFPREQLSVMLLLCSQKTLVLTAAIATALPEQIGTSILNLLVLRGGGG